MKLLIVCALLSTCAFSQVDNLTRMGAILGSREKQTPEQLAQATLKTPISIKSTLDQFLISMRTQVHEEWRIDENDSWSKATEFSSQSPSKIGLKNAPIGFQEIRILQTLTNGFYLAVLFNETLLAVDLRRDDIPDDTSMRIRITKTDRVYRYASTIGSLKTVSIYRLSSEPRIATLDDYCEQFKSGRSFRILLPHQFSCDRCNTSGVVDGMIGSFKKRMRCPKCDGAGHIVYPAVHEVLCNTL